MENGNSAQIIPQSYPLFMARVGKDAPLSEEKLDVLISPVIGWDARDYDDDEKLKPILPSPYGRSAYDDGAEPYSVKNDNFEFCAVGFGVTPEQAEEEARKTFEEDLPRFKDKWAKICAEDPDQ